MTEQSHQIVLFEVSLFLLRDVYSGCHFVAILPGVFSCEQRHINGLQGQSIK